MALWPQTLLFDLDGTLVNSEPLHFFAFQEVLKAEKIDLTEAEYYQELIGFDDRGALRRVFEKSGRPLDPKTSLRLMTRKSQVMLTQIRSRTYRALPGVEELVRGLWRHYPLAVCSGSLREEVEAMLEGVSLRDCFGVIVGSEDVTVGKPDPQGYRVAMRMVAERLRRALEPGDCLVIEDAPTVVKSTRAAGFPVLAVTSTHPADKFPQANWIVKTLDPDVVQKEIPGLKMYR